MRRALAGEPATVRAIERAGTALGRGAVGVLERLGPAGRGARRLYAELAPWLIGPVTAELHERVVSHSWSPVEVVVSSLGADAAVRGAAGVTIKRIIDDPAEWFPEVLAKI